MRVILEVLKGPKGQEGQRFVFERPEAFVVGRKKNERVQCRIPEDPYLSRYHMILEVSPNQCLLRDLGSTNGTRINNKKIRQAFLKDGDVIHAGQSDIRVRIETTAAGPTAGEAVVGSGSAEDGISAGPAVTPARDDWETLIFAEGPRGKRGPLRCAIGGEPATEAYLSGLTDTPFFAYVCPKCREHHHEPDQPIPNYRKLEVLERGVLGPVYKALRVSSGKVVILKVLDPELLADPRAVQLFLRQMLLSTKLQHPRLVPIVEMGQAGPDLAPSSSGKENHLKCETFH